MDVPLAIASQSYGFVKLEMEAITGVDVCVVPLPRINCEASSDAV